MQEIMVSMFVFLYKNMKLLKISKYVCASALLLSITTSCGDFLAVNETPNSPLVVPASTLLPTAVYGMAFANNNEINRFTEVTIQHLAGMGNSPASYERYEVTGFGNQWDGELYQGTLTIAQRLIEFADKNSAPAYSGVGKIIKAYTFALTTDMWGDVPYSEALRGAALIQPRIDKQEDIYKGNSTLAIQSLFDLVREGLADLDKVSPLKPGADDPIYKGNLANWKRAGNTLLLKMALQISSKDPATATTVINQVIASNNLIQDNSQDFSVVFGTVVGATTASYQYTAEAALNLFRNDMVMSKRVLDVMNAQNDPRLPLYFTRPGANYATSENGFFNAPAPTANWSRYNTAITGIGGAGPVRLITNSQRAFMLAEAVVRLKVAGDAQALYQEGIRASMLAAGVSAANITTFFTANTNVVTLSGTDAQRIEQIITQKWISLVGNGYESFNDWRRTGFPVIAESPVAGGIDGTRPRRLVYTDTEISRNPNLIPKGSKPPQTNVRVWWDVR